MYILQIHEVSINLSLAGLKMELLQCVFDMGSNPNNLTWGHNNPMMKVSPMMMPV